MAAVLTWAAGISVLCAAVGIISYVAFPHIFTVIFAESLELILSYIALFLLATGGTVLAMSITGTPLSNLCVTFLVLFLPRFIITIMTTAIENDAEFLVFDSVSNSFFSPDFNVLFGTVILFLFFGNIDYAANLPADIYSIALGLVYLAIALLLFTKRKSETATQPAPGKAVQHIIRIMLTMVVGLFATILFIEGEWAGFIIVSIITAIVYFAYELITTHRWRNLLGALPYYGVVVGLCILCGAVIVCVPKIAASYTPDADDIDSVRLIYDDYYNDDWFGSEAQDLKLRDKDIRRIVADTLKGNMDYYKENGHVGTYYYENLDADDKIYLEHEYDRMITQTVAIKDGAFTKYRTLFFAAEEYAELLSALESNKDYIEACKTLPKPAKNSIWLGIDRNVDYSYCEKVLESLQKEIEALSFEEWYNIAHNAGYYNPEFNLYYTSDDYDSLSVDLHISSNVFPKTFEMVLEAENMDIEQRYREMKKLATDKEFASSDDLWYASIDVTFKVPTDESGRNYYYYFSEYGYENWDDGYYELFEDLLTKVEATDKKPDSDSYVMIRYQYETETDGVYDSVYLPLPDDFDPASWELIIEDTEYHEGIYY